MRTEKRKMFISADPRNFQSMELSMIEFPQLEELCHDVTCEMNQDKWMRLVHSLKIDTDKLHLIAAAHSCDFQRQKTLGLLCWVEGNPKGATFDKLSNAVNAVGNKKTSAEIKSLRRRLLVRKIHTAKCQRPQRQLKQPITSNLTHRGGNRYEFVKSGMANPVWKLSDPISPPYYSSYLPQRSVSPSFELTSSVSIQGAKLNLIKRSAWTDRSGSPRKGTRSLSMASQQQRKRTLGDRKTGFIDITATIRTAIPLTKTTFRDCHPEEISSRIENKLFNYLLSENSGGTCTREAGSVVATLETIDGLVVKKLRRGSLHIEVDLYKPLAAKTLWTHYQNGQLGEMIQEQLISTTSLRMSGALAISLETSINHDEFEACMAALSSGRMGRNVSIGRYLPSGMSKQSSSALKMRSSTSTLTPLPQQKASHPRVYTRVTSVPASRSISLELSPNVSTVRPRVRKAWKADKSGNELPRISLSDVLESETKNLIQDHMLDEKSVIEQRPPPPTPDNTNGPANPEVNVYPNVDESTCKALEEMHKSIHDCEDEYNKFHCEIRRFVDSLKSTSTYGMESVTQVADLRKFATLLRQRDVADTALLVEEFIKLTETMEKIHRDASSRVWSKVSKSPVVENSNNDLKRIQVRQHATQALERWREMLDPMYNFSHLTEVDASSFEGYILPHDITKYSGLLSHVPVLIATGKSVYKIFLNYLQAT